jgi:hypothetical protein
MMLAHTIEAMVGDKPARVHCNTCKASHGYKAKKPSETPRRAKSSESPTGTKTTTSKRHANRLDVLLENKDMSQARPYSPKEKYNPGDILDHPMFGFGVARALKDETKVEVLFKDGTKLLIQGR